MARKLTFDAFRAAVVRRTIPLELLPEYLQFDPASTLPKLTFRADALLDEPRGDYDVDTAICKLLRAADQERELRLESFSFAAQKRVVAEGDSWFNLPEPFRPPAIADRIRRNGRFRVTNIACWGDTLENILRDREHIRAIENERPQFFIFSAGGNDLQLGLAAGTYIHAYEESRPTDKYLTEAGEAAIARIGRGYLDLLAEISQRFPTLRVVCYGYDYPRPLVGNGRYLGQHLRKLGIPDRLMCPIMISVLDKLNEVIERSAHSFSVRYLNCRGVTDPFTWYDDMHPSRDGFEALAARFEEEMGREETVPVDRARTF